MNNGVTAIARDACEAPGCRGRAKYICRGTDAVNGGSGYEPGVVVGAIKHQAMDQRCDGLLMAFFTRHPAVKPEPKLRTWFGNEEEP